MLGICLILPQSLLGVGYDHLDLDVRAFLDALLQRGIFSDVGGNETGNILAVKVCHNQRNGVFAVLLSQHTAQLLTGRYFRYGSFAGDGIHSGHLGDTFQQSQQRFLGTGDLHITCGTAHAGEGGGGADVQTLVLLQRCADIKEQLAAGHKDLQFLARLGDGDLRGGIQLDGLGAVQTDVGIAFAGCGDLIAVVEAHFVRDLQGFAAGILDSDGAFALLKTHRGGSGLFGQCGHGQCADDKDRAE